MGDVSGIIMDMPAPPDDDVPPIGDILSEAAAPEPLQVDPVSTWADRAPPAARDWIIQDLVPARRVTTLYGDGGLGKSTLACQIAVHVAINRALFELKVAGGPVLGIFCEDESDELDRRIRSACRGEQIDLQQLDRLYALSRDGHDNVLCTFRQDKIELTPFYRQLRATAAALRPRLLILDTAADLFAGDMMSTPHVRQFLKVALGSLCVDFDLAVLLIAHPSASGMNSGEGGGYSVAWNNSVRSRMYLRRPASDDKEAIKDRRVLELKKSNYAANGLTIPLVYQDGCFVPDTMPIEEAIKGRRDSNRGDTKLAVAVLDYMRQAGRPGVVIAFHALFQHLSSIKLLVPDYQAARKPLQRALKSLEADTLIKPSITPRGYRLTESPE